MKSVCRSATYHQWIFLSMVGLLQLICAFVTDWENVLCVCVAVTVAYHTSICTVYDFTVHPVSVHLPLTRLLATLYILLDEPVEVGIAVLSEDLCFLFIPLFHMCWNPQLFICCVMLVVCGCCWWWQQKLLLLLLCMQCSDYRRYNFPSSSSGSSGSGIGQLSHPSLRGR